MTPAMSQWDRILAVKRYVQLLAWVVRKFNAFQEYVRVPFADFNALKLPPGTEHEEDFALLADIFPTVRVATYPPYGLNPD